MMVSEAMVDAAARADAAYAGRTFDALASADKVRFTERAKLMLEAALSKDAEPVAEIVSAHGDPEAFGERELVALADIQKFPYGTKLYATPPAPAVTVKATSRADLATAINAKIVEVNERKYGKNRAQWRMLTTGEIVDAVFALSAQVQDVAGELSRINEMMDGGDDEGSPILPEFKDGWSVEAKVEACLHLLEKRRDVIEGFTAKENWRDDPAQDERWNAGLDFAMLQLCKVLKVDPQSINWDCATETLEGDAQSQIHKVLAAASPASKHGDADHG